MTFFVWCEWICKHCNQLRRTRFDVIVNPKALYAIKRKMHVKGNIKIDDIAVNKKQRPTKTRFGGSKIYTDYEEPIQNIVNAAREYMLEYYAIKEGTLTVEVCNG